ncbi:MAG: ATP-dependent helicase [Actinomycetota bacterium]|nr:ATP-dependent helicase [Actinomycetota bacterium]
MTRAGPAYRLVRPEPLVTHAPRLDAEQQRVVAHSGGPLLVLAGPGTGKTTTLVEAAVARIEAGVPVEQILMLTFSRRAAGEMRDRVTARLDRTIREPVARTIHSYAFGVLRLAALAQDLPAPRLLAAPEQDVIMRQLVEGSPAQRWPAALHAALHTRAFAGELRDLLMRAVERGLDGPRLAQLGRNIGRADWIAAGTFLTEYQEVTSLRDPGAYDPAELIRSAVNALLDDDQLLSSERAVRRHIFVDEYQDTDPAQAALIALLGLGADELILVGDPDQAIYAFRGADESAIRDVDARFGRGAQVPIVALRCSRRSGPRLLEATRRIADRLPGRAEQRRLVAADDLLAGQADVHVLRSASEEAAYVAGVLRRAHLDGMPWAQMAILVRSTALALGTLRRAMITAGVPVAVRGEDVPLGEQPAVAMLLDVLSCAIRPDVLSEDVAERLLLGAIGAGDPIYLRRLRRALRQIADPLGEPTLLAPALREPLGAALLPDNVRRPVVRVAEALAAGRRAVERNASAEDVLWAIWAATGLARRWEAASRAGGTAGASADRDLDAVGELFAAAARFTDRLPRSTAAAFAEHISAQQVPGDAMTVGDLAPDAVAILTAHASKGLEWDLVCVANVQEGIWPDMRRRGSLLGSEHLVDLLGGRVVAGSSLTSVLAEERRLFYVALTRARQRVVVTAVAGEEEQPSRFLDELDPIDADRVPASAQRGVYLPGLVAELRAVVCDPGADLTERTAAGVELARLGASKVPGADPSQWWGLGDLSDHGPVARPDAPVPVSPSRIESFLRCELRTLLADLGARDGNQVSASLGMLIHELAASAPPGTDLAEFERLLDEKWATLDFGAAWFARNERARATSILARLAAWLRDSRAEFEEVGTERDFGVEVGDALIRGRVDRLERDRSGRVVVVDLKTTKSKPKPADLPKHPQLAAYQLAVENGAFGIGESSGGALLVQLATKGDTEQRQLPLDESDDPGWIAERVAYVAARYRGNSFIATAGVDCRHCDVRVSCPLQTEGRQVTT